MGKYIKILAGMLACLLFLTACGGREEQEERNRLPQAYAGASVGEAPGRGTEPEEDAVTVFDRLLEKDLYYITEYELNCLKAGALEQPDNWNEWQGEWARTGVVRSCSSYMTLEQTEAEGYYADIFSMYYSHNGSAKGELLFLDDKRAFFEVPDGEMTEDDPPQVVLLKQQDGLVTLVNLGPEYGCGVGVTVEGTYTKGMPEYTNANAMTENFTEAEQERIRTFLETMGVSYAQSFVDVVEYGSGESVWVTAEFEDGTAVTGKRYNGNYPTIGNLSLTLFLAENGYIYWHQPDTGYLTDDPERTDLMGESSRDIYSRLAEEGDFFLGQRPAG